MKSIPRLIFFTLIILSQYLYAESPADFDKAKKTGIKIFITHRNTLYCHCNFDTEKHITLSSCHMQSAKNHTRAFKMEWEHMVPASHLGKGHACWTENLCTDSHGKKYHGRACCSHIDSVFKHKEAELFNLWPADGYINQLRADYDYADLPSGDTSSGCNFSVNNKQHLVEPYGDAKGIVARASLFMAEHYHIQWTSEQIERFQNWNHLYPPSKWEREWEESIYKLEGYHNRYIHDYA